MLTRRAALGLGAGLAIPWLAGRAAAAEGPIVVPIGLTENRVVVACGINGAGPFFFMIDTGGTMSLIEEGLARQLKLPAIASSRIRGMGGDANAAVYRVQEFLIGGGLRERDLAFHGTSGVGFGKDVRGTLAAGAMTSYDSVLDFDAGEWRVYPRGLGDLPGFTAIESRISHPDAHGSAYLYATIGLDGQGFNCILDTGAPGGLILYPEAVRRTRLWDDPTVPYAPMRGAGVGGESAVSRLVRAQSLTIGDMRFDKPLVRLDGGARGQRTADGIVGLALIRQLNLAADTRHGRLLIERNRVPALPDRPPLSGLWIDDHDGKLIVADVGRGGPAAAAGIAPGDRVIASSLGMVVRQFGGAPGKTVPLTIERDGQRRDVTLTLRRYL